ncbi:YjiH family protein [Salinicoccus hispanicus]|uniref:YjiH family protein n=1 Tax=Salinicoccus hispanicus TaxID=157225 RepID=A0A6N8U0K4_9STAP|nr:YjiH family protein [Salinicoccus hispanicus]MXQ51604.1 YjiH family protein [Salinicoccus hispanicus]
MITEKQMQAQKGKGMWRFFLYSAIGVIMFFIPVTLFESSSILLDHFVTLVRNTFGDAIKYYTLLVIVLGAIYPFFAKEWNRSFTDIVITIFKILGVVVGVLVVFGIGPAFILREDIGPFLFNSLAVNLSILIPVGGAVLGLLVGYGLLVFIGVIMEPVMRPLFKTPGRSAVDAVASFVGSYSVGLLITNRVYKDGMYSRKEAMIIATGFSTVSATFMIVIGRTLDLMDHWNLFFWTTLVITFLVTAISVRIPPLRTEKDHYYDGQNNAKQENFEGGRLKYAWYKAKQQSYESDPLMKNIITNLKDAFRMTMTVVPTILSIGLLGLIIVEFTDIIYWISFIFYPVLYIFPVQDAPLLAEAATISIIEMFLPSLLVVDAALETRFITAVISVSCIIFFSALVPCILATEINMKVWKMVVIWLIRVILSLLIVIPFTLLIF